jgi:DNA-binding XRE family transcriptional regulator
VTGADEAQVEVIRERHESVSENLRLGAVAKPYAAVHGDRGDLLAIIDRLCTEVAELQEPVGFHAFVALTERFLKSYPPDIFTGESGDLGPGFVAAVRGAVEGLHASMDPVESGPELRLGTRVRLLRERRNLTVSALARVLGTDRSAVRQIESGKRTNVTLATAERLAEALGTSIDWLARGDAGRGVDVTSDGQT